MSTKYTYKMLIGGTVYDAYPALNGAKLKYSKDGIRRGFRREMNGSLVFYNDASRGISDYNLIMAIAQPTDNITLYIHRDGSEYWVGRFNRYDCKIDEDKATVEVTPRVYDAYYNVVSKLDIQRNILSSFGVNDPMFIAPTTVTLQYGQPYSYEDEIVVGSVLLVPQNSGQLTYDFPIEYTKTGEVTTDRYFLISVDFSYGSGQWDYIALYRRHYAYGTVAPGAGFNAATDQSGAPSGLTKYVRPYLVVPYPYASVIYSKTGGQWEYIYNLQQYAYTPQDWVNKRCRKLNTILQEFASWFGLSFYSKILQDYTNYAYDPLLSVAENPIRNLMLLQKSDSKKTSDAAWKGLISFQDIMNILNNGMNLWWYIDGTTLRIEHESYFEKTNGLDLTSPDYFDFIKGMNRYEYRGDTVRSEVWEFDAAKDVDFIGKPIEYSFVDGYSDSITERRVDAMTDILYAINSPDEISNDGWILLSCDSNNVVLNEIAAFSGVLKPNCHLSVANLQHHYFRHGRPYPTGKMNGKQATFLSVAKRKYQDGVAFAPSHLFNADKLVRTELGWGEVEEATEDLKTEMITTSLKYD